MRDAAEKEDGVSSLSMQKPSSQPRIRGWLVGVDKISMVFVVITMAAMAVIVSLQVFWRYVLGSSIDSADELSRLFFIWAMFLAIPLGIKYAVHVGIDLFIMPLSAAKRNLLFRFVSVAGALLMAAVFYAAYIATIDKWQELMPTLPVTAAVYYIPVLICAAHSFMHLLYLACLGQNAWDGESL